LNYPNPFDDPRRLPLQHPLQIRGSIQEHTGIEDRGQRIEGRIEDRG
jgi:hypothetical protein